MPRQSNTVNRDELHPQGVALDPDATQPHEADPEPNTMEAATKASRNRVNPNMIVSDFEVLDELPAEVASRTRGNAGGGQGRPMADNTLQALRFLRANKGKWVRVGRYPKPAPPSGRMAYAGYFQDDNGNPVDPTEEQERSTKGQDFPIKKKVEHKFGDRNEDGVMVYYRLTDDDFTGPKKRAPKDVVSDVSTTTDTEPSEANA